jgi:heme-degrading monooxygenase HmoA
MFHDQQGFLLVLFTRHGDEVAVLSFWRDEAAIDALDTSTSYQHAAKMIGETGFLLAVSGVEGYEIHDGMVHDAEALLFDVV